MTRRVLIAYVALIALIVIIGATRGVSTAMLLTVVASIYALVALGLNIQFGYGGLSNLAIMGLLMIGGASVSSISMPINMSFWNSDGPMLLARAIGAAAAGAVLVVLAHQLPRIGVSKRVTGWLTLLAWFIGYVFYR
ncbi:MAG: branched-chain amino acid ABC transporter permease, partial [Devosia sp.]